MEDFIGVRDVTGSTRLDEFSACFSARGRRQIATHVGAIEVKSW